MKTINIDSDVKIAQRATKEIKEQINNLEKNLNITRSGIS